jgi:hypothetical protein
VAGSSSSLPGAGHLDRYEIHGRLRLVPAFRDRPLGELSVDDIRGFVAGLAEGVEAGEIAAKTVNNALVTLVVCLNDAVQDELLVANPALRVPRLPPAHIEREYLRLNEIPRYLDTCSDLLAHTPYATDEPHDEWSSSLARAPVRWSMGVCDADSLSGVCRARVVGEGKQACGDFCGRSSVGPQVVALRLSENLMPGDRCRRDCFGARSSPMLS